MKRADVLARNRSQAHQYAVGMSRLTPSKLRMRGSSRLHGRPAAGRRRRTRTGPNSGRSSTVTRLALVLASAAALLTALLAFGIVEPPLAHFGATLSTVDTDAPVEHVSRVTGPSSDYLRLSLNGDVDVIHISFDPTVVTLSGNCWRHTKGSSGHYMLSDFDSSCGSADLSFSISLVTKQRIDGTLEIRARKVRLRTGRALTLRQGGQGQDFAITMLDPNAVGAGDSEIVGAQAGGGAGASCSHASLYAWACHSLASCGQKGCGTTLPAMWIDLLPNDASGKRDLLIASVGICAGIATSSALFAGERALGTSRRRQARPRG